MTAAEEHDALKAVRAQLTVFPLKPGTKAKQLVKSWTKAATDDVEVVAGWVKRWPDMNYGIHCGASGLLVLDADGENAVAAVEAWADEEEFRGVLDATLAVDTPGGGVHWYFLDNSDPTPAQPGGGRGHPITASGEILEHVDWRSSNGYVVGPGSTRQGTKRADYQIRGESGWGTLIVPAPYSVLEGIARTRSHTRPQPRQAAPSPDGARAVHDWGPSLPERPWTAYDRSHTPEDVFAEHSWTQVDTHNPNERSRWLRPGADSSSSAAVYADTGGITIFSSNAEIQDQHFSGAAALKCGLLFPDLTVDEAKTKFVAWLADNGYGIGAKGAASEVRNGVDGHGDGDWPDPDLSLMAMACPSVEPFPLDIFPEFLADHVENIAEATQTPVDLAAITAIGALSAAVTVGRPTIDLGNGWFETPNLYLVVVMESGEGKSPAMRPVIAPLRCFADEQIEQWRAARSKLMSERHQAESILKAAKRSVEKNPTDGTLTREVEIAQQAVEDLPPDGEPTPMLDDSTPEAMAQAILDNGGHLAIVSSEPTVFGDFSRYSDKSQPPNVDLALKAWDGEQVRQRRKRSGVLTLESPLITMVIMAQPVAVERVFEDAEMRGRGLTPRLMLSAPASLRGHKVKRALRQALDPELGQAWADAFRLVVHETAEGGIVQLDDEALDRFNEFCDLVEDLRADGQEFAPIAALAPKVCTCVARAAMLLHFLEQQTAGDPCTGDTMGRAIELGWYWLRHGQQQVEVAALNEDMAAAARVLAWITNQGTEEFTLRELSQTGILRRSHGARHQDMQPVLQVLIESCLIRPDDDQWDLKLSRGKPSPVFTVHPQLAVSGSESDA